MAAKMKTTPADGAPATLARWTEDEHRILVQLTEAQVALESRDGSKMISWSKHWERVSAQLKGHGYNRTATACGLHWKRYPESQRATEAAAGPPWNDAEHEILLRMTNDQLAREMADSSTRMSWGDLWDLVSIRLQESGFNRPADECDAHWNMVENGRWNPGPKDKPEARPPKASGASGNEDERNLADPAQALITTQLPSETRPWTDAEHQNLLKVFQNHYDPADQHDYWGEGVWILISQMHQQGGYDRNWEACIEYWRLDGRFRKGLNHAQGQSSKTSTSAPSTKPKSSTYSALKSLVTKVEQDLEEINFPTDKRTDSTNSQNIDPVPAESDTSEYEPSRSSRKQKSTTKRGPVVRESTPPQKSKPKHNRFSPEQRAILEAEVEKKGLYLENKRRSELAHQLNVEESTIRNWFTNYRSKKNRETIPSTNMFTVSLSNSGHSHLDEQSTPELGTKRRRETFEPIDSTPSSNRQPKKRRLEDEPGISPIQQKPTILASPAQQSPTSGSISQSERSTTSRVTPRRTESTSPATPVENLTWQAINSQPNNKGIHAQNHIAAAPIVTTPQIPTAPAPVPTPDPDSDEGRKAWASREVKRFQAEIESLDRGKTESLEKISTVERKIEEVNNEKNELQEAKLKEISRVISEIEEKYKREYERLRGKHELLNESKETEETAVERNTSEITRKQKGLGHYQAIVDFYEDSGNNV